MFLKYAFFHITVNFSETHPNCSYAYFLSLSGVCFQTNADDTTSSRSRLAHFEELDSVLPKVQPFVCLSFGHVMVKLWLSHPFRLKKKVKES